MIGAAFSLVRSGFGSLFKYCRKNRWTWYLAGALVILGFGYFLAGSHLRKVVSSAESWLKRFTTEEKLVISNANLVVVATGGVTRIILDDTGAPREIVNEGGTIRLEATIATERKEKKEIQETARSSSRFESSEPGRAKSGDWGGRIGYGVAGEPTISLGISRRVVSVLGVDLGLEVAGSVPRDVAGASDLRRRGRVEISITGAFR